MKKSYIALLHLGFWGCYLILIMVMLGIYFRGGEEIDAQIERAFQIIFYFALIPSLITFYCFYFLIFPKFFQQHKFFQAILFGLLISLGAASIGYLNLNYNFGADCFGEEEESSFMGILTFMSFVALVPGIIALVIRGFITWFEEIKLKNALKQKNQEIEMALVKSQLDPHFLFNTINNIDILILKNADKASAYLNKLSDIMRFMLFETKTDKILLSKEIEYMDKYIELQRIRTANESYVNFQVEGKPAQRTIAPMVFIPFLENAFKHTTNKKLENAIDVKIQIAAENIKFECANKFDPNRKRKEEHNGLGNQLIQRRLDLIYPEKHRLDVDQQENSYRVSLSIENE